MRVHFLEERLASLAPDQTEAALKQNINLKIEVQQRGMEMKKLKKLVLELERELQRAGGSKDRERELEEKLEERDRELRELRARLRNGGRGGSGVDEEVLREVEERNKDLENARNCGKYKRWEPSSPNARIRGNLPKNVVRDSFRRQAVSRSKRSTVFAACRRR